MSKFDSGSMEGAAAGFLILAILNWLLHSAKYYVWVWYILDMKTLITQFGAADTSALGGVATPTDASSAAAAASSLAGL